MSSEARAGPQRKGAGSGTTSAAPGVQDRGEATDCANVQQNRAGVTPDQCPRYSNCSAPICPLDPDWRDRAHLDGERVCAWLVELSKTTVRASLPPALSGDQAQAIAEAAPSIYAAHGAIRRRLRQTARTPSRLRG